MNLRTGYDQHRKVVVAILTFIYLTIIFAPFSSYFAAVSGRSLHITGKCSGDCDNDGCSIESSSAHTCCCWQKINRTLSAGCCTAKQPAASATKENITVIKCGLPCGKGKLFSIVKLFKDELPASLFSYINLSEKESVLVMSPLDRLVTRSEKPDFPPPEIS